MGQVFKAGDRLVLAVGAAANEENPTPARRMLDFQLLSPLLLGLLAPFMLAQYLDPDSLKHIKGLIWGFLLVMFLVSTALFFYTHHFPGSIHSIVVDREARTIEIVWRNLMAQASQIVPFEDLRALRVRHDFDEDGRPAVIAELVLGSRAPIRLPSSITEDELRPLRAAVGLG